MKEMKESPKYRRLSPLIFSFIFYFLSKIFERNERTHGGAHQHALSSRKYYHAQQHKSLVSLSSFISFISFIFVFQCDLKG